MWHEIQSRRWLIFWIALGAFALAYSGSFRPACSRVYSTEGYQEGRQNNAVVCPSALTLGTDWIARNKDTFEGLSTFFVALFTFTLWRATLLLWKAGERQIEVGRVSADAAARAAKATEESVRTMAETAKKQLRPYVITREVTRDGEHEIPLTFIIKYVNSGQTPAYDLAIRDGWLCAEKEPAAGVIPISESEYSITLGPQEGSEHLLFILDKKRPFGAAELEAIAKKKISLYVGGSVTYRDIFGDKWESNFKLVYNNENIAGGGMAFCSEGNRAT